MLALILCVAKCLAAFYFLFDMGLLWQRYGALLLV